jgi:hypothetical protein
MTPHRSGHPSWPPVAGLYPNRVERRGSERRGTRGTRHGRTPPRQGRRKWNALRGQVVYSRVVPYLLRRIVLAFYK